MSNTDPAGFLATPATGHGQGVLVLHAWWGLNKDIQDFCNKLSEAGFVAFAPDLYQGALANNIPDAEKLVKAMNSSQATHLVEASTRYLHELCGQDVAVIGFSLGASFALELAAADSSSISSVVLFYGTGEGDFSHSKAVFLGHYAENDPFESLVYVRELEQSIRDAGRPVTFHVYPGTGHWFFEPSREDAYQSRAAQLAWERTLTFLNR